MSDRESFDDYCKRNKIEVKDGELVIYTQRLRPNYQREDHLWSSEFGMDDLQDVYDDQQSKYEKLLAERDAEIKKFKDLIATHDFPKKTDECNECQNRRKVILDLDTKRRELESKLALALDGLRFYAGTKNWVRTKTDFIQIHPLTAWQTSINPRDYSEGWMGNTNVHRIYLGGKTARETIAKIEGEK